jgi:hypothetical protein
MDLDPEVQAALADSEPAPDDLLNLVLKDDENDSVPERKTQKS